MKIGLHNADNGQYPNLALMKLSAHHKSKGDDPEIFFPLMSYDIVYSSKVFTFTPEEMVPSGTIKGGTGYGLPNSLPDEIEHICPDYSLYGIDYSMGFLTRGCNRKCGWCVVPAKEGMAHGHADIEEFLRHKEAVLMDNNVLQVDHGIRQIEKIVQLGVKVDFNQGLDSRLIDDTTARLLSKVKWRSPIRLACDHVGMIKPVERAIQNLRWHNTTPSRFFVYLLVRDIDDAIERVRFLKGMGVDPFAQPFIDQDGNPPTQEQRHFARWVNHKAEFKSRSWEDYRDSKP